MSQPAPARTTPVAAALLGTALACAALAVYQWLELVDIRTGGTVGCAINDTVNCATVWNSEFASRIHAYLRVPVAGLGLVWSLAAAILAGLWLKKPSSVAVAAVKVAAIGGLLGTFVFASASISAGAVCLTCLGTYVLTIGYALAAFLGLPKPLLPEGDDATGGMGWALVVLSPLYLLALYPGAKTPQAPAVTITAKGDAEVKKLLENLPEQEALFASAARAKWLKSEVKAVFTPRALSGPASAPVKVVDFTDVKCGHCKHFEEIVREVRKAVPADRISFEARHFPLDGECNKEVKKVWGDGVRCAGTKAQICLEGSDGLWRFREAIFERQNELTKELVLELASKEMPRGALDACLASPETQAKLDEDIRLALRYGLEGTPLVLVNGRETLPSAHFLLGMAQSAGDVNSDFFKKLPPPPPMDEHEH